MKFWNFQSNLNLLTFDQNVQIFGITWGNKNCFASFVFKHNSKSLHRKIKTNRVTWQSHITYTNLFVTLWTFSAHNTRFKFGSLKNRLSRKLTHHLNITQFHNMSKTWNTHEKKNTCNYWTSESLKYKTRAHWKINNTSHRQTTTKISIQLNSTLHTKRFIKFSWTCTTHHSAVGPQIQFKIKKLKNI